jgi:5'-nucleotidase (lipoprotein e(P4) family)
MHIKRVYSGFAMKVVMSGLVIVFASGPWAFGQQSPTPAATPVCPAEDPANRPLDANLYMQTSAEYRASCYQAYNLATDRLEWLIRHDRANAKRPKELAVVMDLDETVFDNAGFQTRLLRKHFGYCQDLWDEWEKDHSDKIELIPGAKEFILEAKELGVTVVYISNRNEKFRKETKKALIRLGIWDEAAEAVDPAKADKLLKLSTGPSDKTARRQEAQNDYKVLLYVGDNLRDFDEAFRCSKIEEATPAEELERAIKARKEAVDKDPTVWGREWIILPNPAYGEWTKPLGRGQKDYDRLKPTATPTPTPTAAK